MRTSSSVAAILLLCVIASPALSVTHYITDDGLGDYPTIQAAIDASVSGDTITLANGTFSGTGNWDLDFGGKNLVIRSEHGRIACRIDCHGGASGEHRAFHFHGGEDSTAVVYDIQIYHGYVETTNGGGILIENGSNPTIRFCWITDCSSQGSVSPANAGTGGGIAVYNSAPHLIDNNLYSNHADQDGGGVYLNNSPAVLMGNDIYGNTTTNGAGGFYAFESAAVIINNWFDQNSSIGAAILNYSISADDVTFHNNLVTNNTSTFAAGLYWDATVGSPLITSCTFFNNQDGGVYTTSSAVIRDCIFHANGPTEIDAPGATVEYCWVEGGYTGEGNITGVSIAWDFGVSAEPYLPEGNECLDAGSDLASNICSKTEHGYRCFNQMSALQSERPDTGQVDIGHHYIRQRTTLYVPEDADEIQTAIESSVDGDRIEVGGDPGTLYAPINFLGKAIHVIAPIRRRISGSYTETAVTFNSGETSSSILENFAIFYGAGTNGGGIYVGLSSPQIISFSIEECTADNGGGIYVSNGSPIISQFYITSCQADFGGGIYSAGGSPEFLLGSVEGCEALFGGGAYCSYDDAAFTHVNFRQNLATGNVSGSHGGGLFTFYSTANIESCSFTQNTAQENNGISEGGGIYLHADVVGPDVLNCTIAGNTANSGAGVVISGCEMSLDNSIVAFNRTGEAVFCDNGGSVTLSCSDIYNNDGGNWVGCVAGQDSLRNNFSADPVFADLLNDIPTVAESSPCAESNNPACGWVGAYGHSHVQNNETISPDGSGNLATIEDALGTGWICGGDTIFLEDGVFTGPGNVDLSFGGKSVVIKSISGDPELCVIDCEGSSSGGHRGFFLNNREGHTARIEGITIRNGWTGGSGGGIQIWRSHATIENCIFEKCHAFEGGAISSSYGEGLINDCVFDSCTADNAGGGILNAYANPAIRDCWFIDNWANWGGGGIYNHYSSPYIERCGFGGNTSDHWGGGIHNNHPESMPTLQNCSFNRNASPNGGAMFSRNSAAPVVYNSIIAFSTDGVAVHTQTGATTTVYCCDVYGNDDGDYVGGILGQDGANGNFSADPLFCNELLNYLRLTESSPCTQENAGACGLIGAYWEDCHPTTDVEEPDATPKITRLFSCYPNPFNPSTRIAFDLSAKGHVSLRIYDAAGRLVRILVEEDRRAGRFEEVWNGTDNRGGQVASGVYFYRLTTKDFVESKKMILLR